MDIESSILNDYQFLVNVIRGSLVTNLVCNSLSQISLVYTQIQLFYLQILVNNRADWAL